MSIATGLSQALGLPIPAKDCSLLNQASLTERYRGGTTRELKDY